MMYARVYGHCVTKYGNSYIRTQTFGVAASCLTEAAQCAGKVRQNYYSDVHCSTSVVENVSRFR